VQESLFNRFAFPGIFDLMNKGITILASKVKRIDDTNYEIEVEDGQGIVDGGHTYKIICDAQDDPSMPDDQHVDLHVRTGIDDEMVSEISRGLNTGMQVKQHSLDNLDGKFDWVKEELAKESYFKLIAWSESDKGDYDIRDIIAALEAMNVLDFPNDAGTHPVQAYEKWSVPAEKFSKDAEASKDDLSKSKYHRLRPILKEALVLFDHIRRDFREVYNDEKLGSGGKLDIIEKARADRTFDFPFAGLKAAEYRLTKGGTYPVFAAFRNKVKINTKTGEAYWDGGFQSVLGLWKFAAPEICRAMKDAIKDIGHKPDQLGKNRGHWSNMHKTVELFILRQALKDKK
jgi:AIPR protein